MKQIRCHVGVPRFIEERFAINGRVAAYNLNKHIAYYANIDDLGVEKGYYSEVVEQNILAKGIENDFAIFHRAFCEKCSFDELIDCLKRNLLLFEQFASFMFLRSKKVFNDIESRSITKYLVDDFSHSLVLSIQSQIQINVLNILGNKYSIVPFVNQTEINLINNSIGFALVPYKGNKAFIFPMDLDIGIFAYPFDNERTEMFFIPSTEKGLANRINQMMYETEKEIGNGFIFAQTMEELIGFIGDK